MAAQIFFQGNLTWGVASGQPPAAAPSWSSESSSVNVFTSFIWKPRLPPSCSHPKAGYSEGAGARLLLPTLSSSRKQSLFWEGGSNHQDSPMILQWAWDIEPCETSLTMGRSVGVHGNSSVWLPKLECKSHHNCYLMSPRSFTLGAAVLWRCLCGR